MHDKTHICHFRVQNPESSMLKGFRQLVQISSEMLDIDESLEEVVVNEGKLH